MAASIGLRLAGCIHGLFLIAHLGHSGVRGLRLNRLTVPDIQDYREHATLACEYELITNKLNSVKWYKDGSEFFRYAPMQQPAIVMFRVAGVHVHNQSVDCDTESCRIQLWYLERQTSGVYRCEVSGDAPDFKLASRMANMTVGALPQHDPVVGGLQQQYAYGDSIQAGCSTDKSYPPATISWTINDVPIVVHQMQTMRNTETNVDAATTTATAAAAATAMSFMLQNRSLDLSYYIDQADWGQVRRLAVRCTAVLDGFPRHRRQTEIVIDVGLTNTLSNERLINPKGAAARMNVHRLTALAVVLTLFHLSNTRH